MNKLSGGVPKVPKDGGKGSDDTAAEKPEEKSMALSLKSVSTMFFYTNYKV